ncbi:hypothetical protein MTO96_030188 [Rhipicephalus appendiculatus]
MLHEETAVPYTETSRELESTVHLSSSAKAAMEQESDKPPSEQPGPPESADIADNLDTPPSRQYAIVKATMTSSLRNDWFEVSVLVESTLKSSSLKLDVIFNWDYAPGERRSFPEVARVAIVSSDGCFDLIRPGESGRLNPVMYHAPKWQKDYKKEGHLTLVVIIKLE